MTTIPLTACCTMLGIDPKTLRHWLHQAQMPLHVHPTDARIKCLTSEQVQQLAVVHARPLALPILAPPARREAAPAPGSTEEQAQASPESQAHLVQTAPLLPPSGLEEADLRKKLSCLERSVTSMQEQLAQLALQLLQERSLRSADVQSAPEALLHPKLDALASVHELEALVQAHQPEDSSTTTRRLHPAEQRARSRVIPLIEYGAAGSYVVICPQQGALELVPDSPAWFDWLATLSSFRFVGQQGRLSVCRKSSTSRGWCGYRTIHQRNYRHYLGVTDHLTIACLEHGAATLQSHLAPL